MVKYCKREAVVINTSILLKAVPKTPPTLSSRTNGLLRTMNKEIEIQIKGELMKILITIAYDGTNYSGWQIQKNTLTIQKKVTEAVSKLYNEEISILGASRTDSGVHALGQRAAFTCNNKIPLEKLPYALNAFLPSDIRIFKAEEVSADFHPINDAINKTYRYKIENSDFQNPLSRNFAWHYPYALDFEKMKRASADFIGTYDFSAFCSSGSSAKSMIRTINTLELQKDGARIYFDINGNGFLYNMVRIIAGTLVYAGIGKIKEGEIKEIIASKKRKNAGITAPPEGLTLIQVNYH